MPLNDEVNPKELAAAMRVAKDNLLAVIATLHTQGMKRMVLSLALEFESLADLIERGLIDLGRADDLARGMAVDSLQVGRVLGAIFYSVRNEEGTN